MFGKLQAAIVEEQTWEITWPSKKSEITGFYMSDNSKFTGRFSWGCSMRHRLLWFRWCCFWFPYFFNRPFCGRLCCKTSIICICCWSRWFTSTNLRSSLLLPLLSLLLVLEKSLPNSCVFSSISPFAMFAKSISCCTILFEAFSLFIIQD